MKKILFAITSLTLGGAERVLVDICNELCDIYDVNILTLYGEGEFSKQLDSKVKVKSIYETSFNNTSKIKRIWLSITLQIPFLRNRLYKKYINNYDVEIAFLEGPVTWLLSSKSKAKKIAWVHNDVEKVFGSGLSSKIKKSINKKAYNKYEDLIFVSNDNLDMFNRIYLANRSRKRVIYNYIDAETVKKKADLFIPDEISKELPSFVTVARLTEQKALDRLIKVHSRLISEGYKHNIYVVGNGHLEEYLNNLIKELGVSQTFHLLGKRENPYPYILAGDNFLLASHYEGYPMVLLEAKALGKYILITDNASREVVIDYTDKLIMANSEQGIYDGLKKTIMNKGKKQNKGKFDNKNILKEIKNVIEG